MKSFLLLLCFLFSVKAYSQRLTNEITSNNYGVKVSTSTTSITVTGKVIPGKGTTGTVKCLSNTYTATFSNANDWSVSIPLTSTGPISFNCVYSKDGSTASAPFLIHRTNGDAPPVARIEYSAADAVPVDHSYAFSVGKSLSFPTQKMTN